MKTFIALGGWKQNCYKFWIEALVNNDSNPSCPKVVKFLVTKVVTYMNILICNLQHGLNLIFGIFYYILSKITQTKYQNLKNTVYQKIQIKNKK